MLESDQFAPVTQDGWHLDVTRFRVPESFNPNLHPVVIIPGYGMNDFVFSFHPSGKSMIEVIADHGFEVWSANLRIQGESYCEDSSGTYGLRELSLSDVPSVLDLVLDHRGQFSEVHGIGCSLGATVLYSYLAHHQGAHPLRSLVSVGGPLRWDKVHPALAYAFASPLLAALLPIRGVRPAAELFMPFIQRHPSLLSIYMNSEQIDMSEASELIKTVENPNRYLNLQVSHWIRSRELRVAGVDVTEAMGDINLPLLCVAANEDGIVPRQAATSIIDAIGSDDISYMLIGDDEHWHAHADLFIADGIQDRFFEPMSNWLLERDRGINSTG